MSTDRFAELASMPVVTVEQVNRFRETALRFVAEQDEEIKVLKVVENNLLNLALDTESY